MKRMCFSSPKIVSVLITTAATSVILAELIVLLFAPNEAKLVLSVASVVLPWGYFLFSFIKFRNAFVLFSIDEEGIHTKYLDLDWTSFSSYEVLETNVYYAGQDKNPWYKANTPSVVCIGNVVKGKSFLSQNHRKCIFFSIIPKHMKLIEQYGRGKSEFVDHFLDDYKAYAE